MLDQVRVAGVLKKCEELNCSQILISDPMAIFYFTGKMFYPGERFVGLYLNQDGSQVLFNNKLFPCEEIGCEIVWLDDTDDMMEIVSQYTNPTQVLGVDKELPAKFLLPLMEKGAGSSYMNASLAVDRQRAQKDPLEQERMRKSSLMNDLAMERFQALIHPGVTEREVADQLPGIYLELGADHIDFGIVAFGANAADPHHMPDDTVLKEGDCVLLDVGAVREAYCSDMTRTFFFRSVDSRHAEIYEIVKKANEAAEAMIRPGVRFCDIDKKARDVITEAGYGPYFTHRLGHSIGLQDHEFGDVSSVNADVVKPGMTFSIEPGIYLPGDVGVRVEDLVLVTEDGVEILNHYPKNLCIL